MNQKRKIDNSFWILLKLVMLAMLCWIVTMITMDFFKEKDEKVMNEKYYQKGFFDGKEEAKKEYEAEKLLWDQKTAEVTTKLLQESGLFPKKEIPFNIHKHIEKGKPL